MNSKQYLDRLLVRYSGTFNIYKPYCIGGREFDAYGYFYNHLEKYVLVRDANLWSSDSYEHILFLTTPELTEEIVKDMKRILVNHVEPQLVRKGEKNPPKNHMYSYMTAVMITDKKPEKNVIKSVKNFHFDQGYMMNVRGYSQVHFCLVSIEDEKVYTNPAARKKKKALKEVIREVKAHKIGFEEMCEKHQIEPIHQEEQQSEN